METFEEVKMELLRPSTGARLVLAWGWVRHCLLQWEGGREVLGIRNLLLIFAPRTSSSVSRSK